MFKKILIANRGEIACRVIRACREMKIGTVAVYSDADKDAMHVRMADETFHIGPPPSSESYLRWDKIIDVAKKAGVEAIHPGYGFLSENAEFVREVTKAGITFIGPPPEAMESMGGKMAARKIAIEAGVPVVPGATEPLTSYEDAKETAASIGYPVMLKASAGGGGKGMRLVMDETELKSGLEASQSEALASFGDDEVYVEKAVVRPRHIEIQVFSDTHGNHVHLGERECSIQRRHQKVVEEAPSPINSAELRAEMGACAVKVARAVDYVGAGTVEFLVSDLDRSFYFLEMNTRLQVEHPVTELVTGIDLVREQIRVAWGEKLSFTQEDVVFKGHAIECRVYAEDPEHNFMPSPGRITRLRLPHGPGVRDDGGVYEGAEVSIFYDPMISKFAVFGKDREEAIDRMRRALMEYEIGGIKTTLPFFRELMVDEEFIDGKLDTGFIPRFNERKKAAEINQVTRDMAMIGAALAYSKNQKNANMSENKEQSRQSRWGRIGREMGLSARLCLVLLIILVSTFVSFAQRPQAFIGTTIELPYATSLEFASTESKQLRDFLLDSWANKRISSIDVIFYSREGGKVTNTYLIQENRQAKWQISSIRTGSECMERCWIIKRTVTVYDSLSGIPTSDKVRITKIVLANSKTGAREEI